jgi:hypothetical protein
MAMQMSLGKLALDVKGVIGRLDPLDGADLTLKAEQPEGCRSKAGSSGHRHRTSARRHATEVACARWTSI